MKTLVATLSQKPLWEGDLPPIQEGTRIVVGTPGSQKPQNWMVHRAFIHLDGSEPPRQTVYVTEASVHIPRPQDCRVSSQS